MPTITINGQSYEFEDGQTILQVALDHEIEIPHYCWHPGLSVVANCRICLAEVHAPNPRNDNKVEYVGKLLPTCQTGAVDGMVVRTDSPKAVANQKAVMEYLLINHPVDCAVCDQAGECHLQDYSYQYGRGQARFQEQKIKQPKKDVGPNILLYSDRCIMCTRCVRFTREISETDELIVDGRGAYEQIDVFPGMALDNEIAGNVVDLCPVGAFLDKDFLFQQRVWFLKSTPSIDGLTASGDNLMIEHNDGTVYRVKPRTNLEVNRYWISDEVRYGWKFVHAEERLHVPAVKGEEPFALEEAPLAYEAAYAAITEKAAAAGTIALLVSPMLSSEDAYWLAQWASSFDGKVVFGLGPVPFDGEDKTFADGYTVYAEKAPNARGVKRVLESFGTVLDADAFIAALGSADVAVITGNYPSDWITDALAKAANTPFTVAIDTLANRLTATADVVLPGATWMEKAGSFENAKGRMQTFDRAIEPIDYCKSEAQLALDLIAARDGVAPTIFNPAETRQALASEKGLEAFVNAVHVPDVAPERASDMQLVVL